MSDMESTDKPKSKSKSVEIPNRDRSNQFNQALTVLRESGEIVNDQQSKALMQFLLTAVWSQSFDFMMAPHFNSHSIPAITELVQIHSRSFELPRDFTGRPSSTDLSIEMLDSVNTLICNCKELELQGPIPIGQYSATDHIYVLSPPSIMLGYMEQWLQVSPDILPTWEKMTLEPYAPGKKVRYAVISPIQYYSDKVPDFFKDLTSMFEGCKLGSHLPIHNEQYLFWVNMQKQLLPERKANKAKQVFIQEYIKQLTLVVQNQGMTNIIIYNFCSGSSFESIRTSSKSKTKIRRSCCTLLSESSSI
jgi:hypothetical protein